MEPWDGPASIAFTDGTVIGAVLDRNGLRPSRYWVTDDDLVIMASRGRRARRRRPRRSCSKGRLEPGKIFLVDTTQGRIIPDDEIKAELAALHPYQDWLDAGLVLPRRPAAAVPARAAAQLGGAAAAHVRLHAGRPAPDHRADGAQRGRVARLDGHRHAGAGDLRPAAHALRVLQAAVRAGDEPAARRQLRSARHVAQLDDRARGQPARPRPRLVPPDRVPDRRSSPTRSSRSCATSTTATTRCPGFTPFTVYCNYPVAEGGDGLRMAIDNVRTQVSDGDRRRREPHHPLRPLRRRRERADPRAARHGGGAPPPRAREDAHARRARRRDRRSARGAPLLRCCSATAPARSTRTSRSTRSATCCREGVLSGPHRTQGRQELREGRGQGHPQGDVEDGHLDRRVLHRRADLRGGRARSRRSSTSTSPAPRRASRASTST